MEAKKSIYEGVCVCVCVCVCVKLVPKVWLAVLKGGHTGNILNGESFVFIHIYVVME
jgi:hypothetical protein